jgi:hypothetical protein
MSLIFMEGFDYQTYDDITIKWAGARIVLGGQAFNPGRYGGQCFCAPNNNYQASYISRYVGQYVTGIVGFAYKCNAAPANGYTPPIFVFYDGVAGAAQISLGLTSGGNLQVYRGATIIGTSAAPIAFNTWMYIEIKTTIDPTGGSVEVRVNEATVLSLVALNTRSTANSYFTTFQLGTATNSSNSSVNPIVQYDDFYFCDTAGTDNNNYLGDVRVETLRPSTVGARNDFTPNVTLGAHRYWRLYIYESNSPAGFQTNIYEWQLRETPSGPNVLGGGTLSASSFYQNNSSFAPAFAIDGNLNNNWSSNTGTNCWLAYDFGAGNAKDIREYAIYHQYNGSQYMPYRHALQYSDDGVLWYTAIVGSLTPVWNATEWKVFTASTLTKVNMVDDSPIDVFDANVANTVGAKQTYGFTDLSTLSSTVMGVQVVNLVAKDDAGTRTAANIVRSGTTEILGSPVPVASSSMNVLSVHERDPATNAAWSATAVNAAEFGVAIVT